MKKCATCKEEKPFTDFHKYKKSPDGYKYSCKSCLQVKAQKYKKEKKENCLYRIRNTTEKKVYIGVTDWFQKRKATHLSMLRLNQHRNPTLQKDFNRLGEGCFSFEKVKKLEIGLTKKELLIIEGYEMIVAENLGFVLYNKERNRTAIASVTGEKKCPKCGVVKKLNSFHKRKDNKRLDGRRTYCKSCVSKQKQESKGRVPVDTNQLQLWDLLETEEGKN